MHSKCSYSIDSDDSIHQIVSYYLNDIELQNQIIYILSLCTQGSQSQMKYMADNGVISILVNTFWSSPLFQIKSLASQSLTNIRKSPSDVSYRDIILDHDILRGILTFLKQQQNEPIPFATDMELLRYLSSSIFSFCEGKPPPKWKYIITACEILMILIQSNNDQVIQGKLWRWNI